METKKLAFSYLISWVDFHVRMGARETERYSSIVDITLKLLEIRWFKTIFIVWCQTVWLSWQASACFLIKQIWRISIHHSSMICRIFQTSSLQNQRSNYSQSVKLVAKSMTAKYNNNGERTTLLCAAQIIDFHDLWSPMEKKFIYIAD